MVLQRLNHAREIMGLNFFGPQEWRQHHDLSLPRAKFEKVAEFPWSSKILLSACPFHRGKQVKDTHFAFLGIDHDGRRALTIRSWNEFYDTFGPPRYAGPQRFFYHYYDVWYRGEEFAIASTCQLRWYLCLKEIVPGSEDKKFKVQEKMLPVSYEVPTAVEEVTKHMLFFDRAQIFLNRERYARVSDIGSEGRRIQVGNGPAPSLYIIDCPINGTASFSGVAASRKPGM